MTALRIFVLTLCLLLSGYSAFAAALLPDGSSFTVEFSPHGKSLELVLSCIHAARQKILVAVYAFTSKPISKALLAAHKRGVTVQIVVDKKDDGIQYRAASALANLRLPVRVNGMYELHHKFMVVDGKHVQTGSFNYSYAAANKNAENVLVLWNVPALATQYEAEWLRLWNEAEALPAKY